MWGQWFGEISETDNKWLTLNIDRDRQDSGIVIFHTSPYPYIWNVESSENNDKKRFTANLTKPDPGDNNYLRTIIVADREKFPTSARLEGEIEKDVIKGVLRLNNGVSYTFALLKLTKDLTPTKADHTFRWKEFKDWASDPEHQAKRTIFRGHPDSRYRLSSTFHRTGRHDLLRYVREDVPKLNQYISETVGKSFDLNNAEDHAGLLNLVQHHGYPTPLLDWTESPFVAAFFAFNKIPKTPDSDGDIRIFALDRESFNNSSYPSADHTYDFAPALSVLDLPFRDNQKAVPQQSVQTFSNIYDPEMLIDIWQEADGCRYLTKIDIAKSERNIVMSELERMDITASNLFPGLDGMCQTLKEKYF